MKRISEYKLPIWGLPIFALVGFGSAFVGYAMFFWSFYTPGLPSDVPRGTGFTLTGIAMLIYFPSAIILNLFLAIGLLMRWNKARIIAIFLSPVPIIGVALDQLLNAGLSVTSAQLLTLRQISDMLTVAGISFPSIAPFISTYFRYEVNSVMILFALLNIGIPLYLSNSHIRTQFKRTRVSLGQIEPTTTEPYGFVFCTDTLVFLIEFLSRNLNK